MELEIGDIVMCTVERIVGTIVFVKIEGGGEGSIRNLRNYVVPKKRIVCKVLRISGNRIDLSLRRVTPKEKKEVVAQYKQEQSYKSILKSVLGKETDRIIKDITKHKIIYDFIEEAKENSKNLEKLVGKTNSQKIIDILKKQKQKKAVLKKEINLTTIQPNGLELIKKILTEIKQAEVKYLSAGKYTIKTEDKDIKTADNKLKKIFNEIENKAKKYKIEFSIKEK